MYQKILTYCTHSKEKVCENGLRTLGFFFKNFNYNDLQQIIDSQSSSSS